MMTTATTGVYSLVIHVKRGFNIRVGALGLQRFPEGYYVYTGSALGPGGLQARILRHMRLSRNGVVHSRPFWHIDFLLAHEKSSLIAVFAAETLRNLECEVNQHIRDRGRAEIPIPGFGASDCRKNCESHLLFFRVEDVSSKVAGLYAEKFGTERLVSFDV